MESEARKHFDAVKAIWYAANQEILAYLTALDGDTSRAVGQLVDKTRQCPLSKPWLDLAVAEFIHSDGELWHQVADSRKW